MAAGDLLLPEVVREQLVEVKKKFLKGGLLEMVVNEGDGDLIDGFRIFYWGSQEQKFDYHHYCPNHNLGKEGQEQEEGK